MAMLLLFGVAALLFSDGAAALGEPEVSIVSPADGSIYRSPDIRVIGAAWNATQVQARLTGGDWVNATFVNGTGMGDAWTASFPGHAPNGVLTIEARGWNGSTGSAPVFRTFQLDVLLTVSILQPPQDLILSVPAGPVTVSGRIFFQGTSIPAPGIDVQVHVNGLLVGQAITGSEGVFVTQADLSARAPGQYTLIVSTSPDYGATQSSVIQISLPTHSEDRYTLPLVIPLVVIAIAGLGLGLVAVYLVIRRRK